MRKVFVDVTAVFTKDGVLTPVSFIWEDGTIYNIDKLYDYKTAASLKTGGQGVRYDCRVMGKQISIYLEDQKWFIEAE